ncbi:MAG TPA: dihydroneopterin aldolase [Bacteroidetes bacterium]|jgi:dihydroneopterin aldolase|nr:dihydroneopterin aldolase [Bacteroidota bacterium]
MNPGKIKLNNMEFYGFHGVPDSERKIKQLFVISVTMDFDFTIAAVKDNLNDTINYVKVYNICKEEMKKEYKLIESMAYSIAHTIKNKFSGITNIEVKIAKPQVQIKGKLENVEVVYIL